MFASSSSPPLQVVHISYVRRTHRCARGAFTPAGGGSGARIRTHTLAAIHKHQHGRNESETFRSELAAVTSIYFSFASFFLYINSRTSFIRSAAPCSQIYTSSIFRLLLFNCLLCLIARAFAQDGGKIARPNGRCIEQVIRNNIYIYKLIFVMRVNRWCIVQFNSCSQPVMGFEKCLK